MMEYKPLLMTTRSVIESTSQDVTQDLILLVLICTWMIDPGILGCLGVVYCRSELPHLC